MNCELIKGGTVVNEGKKLKADIIVEDCRIKEILTEGIDEKYSVGSFSNVINAEGAYVLPGIIDSHVHFREPGLTHKADMESESRAAVYGGVTSVFDMPNTKPQTTTINALHEKQALAKEKMHVNYAFFPGATNDNLDELRQMDIHTIPGIKLFMGSSTGNMLVDREEALEGVFALAKEMGLPLMAHCEDTSIINHNMARVKEETGLADPPIQYHPYIRSEEACYESSALGARLAKKHGTQFHIAHITTARELTLLGGNITGEATVAHLLFSKEDYDQKGALIKCNPAIKTLNDRDALRLALSIHNSQFTVSSQSSSHSCHSSQLPNDQTTKRPNDQTSNLTTIGTDHAPHTLEEKQGGCQQAMSGMPMIQFSLVSMLSLVDKEVLTIERLVELMAHNPATLFGVSERGFLRPGYKADITIVRKGTPWEVSKDNIQSKCGWSPLEGKSFNWRVCQTIINGQIAYSDGNFNSTILGEPIKFRV